MACAHSLLRQIGQRGMRHHLFHWALLCTPEMRAPACNSSRTSSCSIPACSDGVLVGWVSQSRHVHRLGQGAEPVWRDLTYRGVSLQQLSTGRTGCLHSASYLSQVVLCVLPTFVMQSARASSVGLAAAAEGFTSCRRLHIHCLTQARARKFKPTATTIAGPLKNTKQAHRSTCLHLEHRDTSLHLDQLSFPSTHSQALCLQSSSARLQPGPH